jgi:arylsulfatase
MAQRPNLLFLMPDQLRADFLGCYGANFVSTPHIDQIAAQGIRYRRAYSTAPICVPARASLLTGYNAIRTGVTDNGLWLRPDHATCGMPTWPEVLSAQDYYTAAIGKMHFYPWDDRLGFQYRAIAEDKRWLHIRDDYYHFLRDHGQRKLHGNEHDGYYENRGAIVNRIPWDLSVDHFVGEETCRFLRTYGQEAPFALMVGFPGPHCPYDPNAEFLQQIDPAAQPMAIPEAPGAAPLLRQRNIDGNRRPWNGVDYTEFNEEHKRKIRTHYAALVHQIDHEVGAILSTLAETGLAENTVIIFASDHGDYLGDHNLIGKGSFFETSIHVPLIIQAPGMKDAETCDDLVELLDVTATLLHYAGCPAPSQLDSTPLPGVGSPNERRREFLIGATSDGWMVYDGVWKLAKYSTGEQLLFNLVDDPTEQHNLIHDPAYSQRYHQLDTLLTQEVMGSLTQSHAEKRVYATDSLSGDAAFGKEGWRRVYPAPLGIGG